MVARNGRSWMDVHLHRLDIKFSVYIKKSRFILKTVNETLSNNMGKTIKTELLSQIQDAVFNDRMKAEDNHLKDLP